MTPATNSRAEAKTSGAPPVILASASSSRRAILENAGIAFSAQPASIDEEEVKLALKAEGASAIEAAESLAELKAQRLSQQHPEALVIGADQILLCGAVWFDKPADLSHAAAHLKALGGKTHSLETAVCLVRGGRRIWHHQAVPQLTMRMLSDDFIAGYLAAAGEAVLSSVGAYQLEGRGAQLFSRIDGDFFAILGLPLLPLLDILREQGVLPR